MTSTSKIDPTPDNQTLEMFSMLSDDTRLRVERDVEQAKANAEAELAENDISDSAKPVLLFHIAVASKALHLLARSELEARDVRGKR